MARYDGWPVYFATMDRLRDIRDDGVACFVWPEEGHFSEDRFIFNQDHRDFEPLMIDIQTTNLLLTIYASLEKPENKAKFEQWVAKSRAHFAKLVEFGWSRVKTRT